MHHDASLTTPCAWRDRFEALVASRLAMPFQWGVHDCCLWAADAVQAITGTDHAADVRGTYSTAAGAVRTLATLGGLEAVAVRAGEPIAPLAAAVGDVGLITLEDRQMLAMCAGEVWLVAGTDGLAARGLAEASKAWKVQRG